MLLNLLMSYTALMVLLAFALIIHDVLELAADERAIETLDGRNKHLKIFNELVAEMKSGTDKSPIPLEQSKKEELLQELADVPFPIRAYSDRSGQQSKMIHKMISFLRAKTAKK